MTTPLACSRCGTPLPAGARFCVRCGSDVSGEQAALDTQRITSVAAGDPQADLLEQLRRATIGEFEVLGELGRGGMATVFLAHEIPLDRKVAVKVMHPSLLATGPSMLERFKREARTAAQLSHPHIIPIYAVREAGGLIFFVMKFVKGRSLDAIIKDTGPLPVPMAQVILAQAGGAIDYGHHQGTIHRDIKPANIMLDEDGWAVVTDFGIAKVADAQHLTMTGATVGTPTYMSPEQCAARDVTAASDQYSLGIVAYEMFTGHVPFAADTLMGVMWQHFNDPPRPLRELRPELPPELESVVLRMLAKKPEARFPAVEDAIDAFGAPTLRKDDPIRLQMKGLAREGQGARMLARVHTPTSPVPRTATPPAATPPRPVTPVPAPVTPIPSGVTADAPTVVTGPAIAEAPTTVTPVPAASLGTVAAPQATPVAARPKTAPAPPPRERRRLRAAPLAITAGVLLALGAGAWLLLRPGRPTPNGETVPNDTATRIPASPAPVAAVTVAPPSASIAVGATVRLSAAPTDAAGTALPDRNVSWLASDTAIVSVSRDGLVTARAPGTATVTATSEGRSAAATVVVTPTVTPVASLAVTPDAPTVASGDTLALVAQPRDERGTALGGRAVTWSSSTPAVARVSDIGVVTALREGRATITAETEGRRAAARVTVAPPAVAAVQVTPVQVSLAPGERAQLAAAARDRRGNPLAGRPAMWSSSDEDVALVTSGGTVRALAPGRATVTAAIDSVSGTASVTVAAAPVAMLDVTAPPDLLVGATAQLRVTTRDAQGRTLQDREVSWSSSGPRVATVSRSGEVTAVGPGTATITATSEGRSASVTVTVTPSEAARPPTETGPPRGGGGAAALPRRAIAAGGQHSCGITAAGGVSCWGSNSAMQLGDAGTGQQELTAVPLGAVRGATRIAAGGGHTCVLAEGGQAVCWGQNSRGQLGAVASGLPLVTVPGHTFTALASGARHTCGLAADGVAWCWGDNAAGQLGDGTTRGGTSPRQVKGGVRFRAIAAGSDHTCAVAQSGKVFCWGDGFSGQLGRGIRESQLEPVEVSLPGPASAVTAGGKHACALGQSGAAWCWGENRSGEIGDGSRAERAQPVAVGGGLQFAALEAGGNHTCGLTAAGEAHCWGDNRAGQLGDGTRAARTQPTKVAGGPFRAISAGGGHTCAITRSDEALCWGANARGQVGDGSTEPRSVPTAVAVRQ